MCAPVGEAESSTRPAELRGSVLDVLQDLLVGRNDSAIVELVAKLVSRNRELEMLLAHVRTGKHSSERVAKEQLDLFLDKLRAASEGELKAADESLQKTAGDLGGRHRAARPPKQPALRRPIPAGLRRVDHPIAVPPDERPCPTCGKERTCIAHERTEVIDFKPAEVFVRVDVKEVLACTACDAELVRAPMGDKVVAGGAYGSALVAKLLVSKYWDGMPLHRQGEELARLGLAMPSSSMSDQITWATDLLRPIWTLLTTDIINADVMHVDGTSLPVLDRDSAKGIVTGALWGYVGDRSTAVYLYTSTAKKTGQLEGELGPDDLLRLRHGPIVADASNLFDALFQSPDRIEVGCNMHARRYWVKALEAGDARASVPVAAYRALYDVEDDVRALDADARKQQRQQRSKPIYDELLTWCRTYQALEPPGSLLAKAIQYLDNHHVALTRFLDDGRLPIDNGIVERLHRRPAVGRRNYLFAGSHAAGTRSAIAYSVLATCYLLDINPTEYLSDVLPRLARGIFKRAELRDLVPANWLAARATAAPVPQAT